MVKVSPATAPVPVRFTATEVPSLASVLLIPPAPFSGISLIVGALGLVSPPTKLLKSDVGPKMSVQANDPSLVLVPEISLLMLLVFSLDITAKRKSEVVLIAGSPSSFCR